MVIAVCSFALALDGSRQRVGTGIGSAAPTPLRATAAEDMLAGELSWQSRGAASEAVVRRFGELVATAASPIDDVRGTAGYRRHALAVLAARTLTWAWREYRMRVTCTVNGQRCEADAVWPGESLLYMLRERLGLPGSKNACEQGECGSCTVYLDGVAVCACLVAAGQAEGRAIGTVEGLTIRDGLHPIQEAFLEAGAVQCGFCTPGLIVAVHDLLARDSGPERAGYPRGPGRQPVPLHRVREDSRRGAARGVAGRHQSGAAP